MKQHDRPAPPAAGVVLVAAGSSTRMGVERGVRKPFLELAGRTLLECAAEAFAEVESVCELVLVVHVDDLERARSLAAHSAALAKTRAVVAGGAQRIDSVRAGVEALSHAVELACVHDAARPLIEREVVERALALAAREGAALVAVPVRDTLKLSRDGARAERTLDRSETWSAQTPQIFRAAVLRELLARATAEGFTPTDDAALWERYRGPVPIVEGSPANLKITTRADLELAEAVLARRADLERQR